MSSLSQPSIKNIVTLAFIGVIGGGVLGFTLSYMVFQPEIMELKVDYIETASYVIFKKGSTFYSKNGQTGEVTNSNDDETLIQSAITATSTNGGTVYIKAGSYSASVTLKDKVHLIVEKGATGINVSIDSGATCWIEDFNADKTWFYVNGSLYWEEDHATGKITTLYGNFTTILYCIEIDEAISGEKVKILKLIVENGTSFPTSPAESQVFFRTDHDLLYVYDGSSWQTVGYRDHGNMTGLNDDDHTIYLLANGARSLTGDWNVGTYGIYGVSWLNTTSLKFTDELWWGSYNRTDVIAYPEQSTSYVIFGDDIDDDGVLDTIYAKNGTTGHIDFSGADAYTVAQSAINALPRSGGEIIFRSGRYYLSNFIKVTKNGTTLTSEHAELYTMDNTNSPAIVVGDYQHENPEFTIVDAIIEGFFIDGNRLHQTSEYNGEYTYLRNNCITFRKANMCSIKNCRLKSARSGGFVSEKNCKYLNIEDSIAWDAHFDGFCGYETERSIFNRLTAYGNLYSGFSFDWGFNRNTLYALIAFNNSDNGVFIDRGSWNIFYGCYIAENKGNGFCFPNAEAGSIVRNGIQCSHIMDNGDCGVYMGSGAEFTFVHGCQILNNPNGGIIGGTNTIDLDNVVA